MDFADFWQPSLELRGGCLLSMIKVYDKRCEPDHVYIETCRITSYIFNGLLQLKQRSVVTNKVLRPRGVARVLKLAGHNQGP